MVRLVSHGVIGRRWSDASGIYFTISISAHDHFIPEEGFYFYGFYDKNGQDLDWI